MNVAIEVQVARRPVKYRTHTDGTWCRFGKGERRLANDEAFGLIERWTKMELKRVNAEE